MQLRMLRDHLHHHPEPIKMLQKCQNSVKKNIYFNIKRVNNLKLDMENLKRNHDVILWYIL